MAIEERRVENYLTSEVKKVGGDTRKWVSPGRDGVPDRIVFFPSDIGTGYAHQVYVEVKTSHGKLSDVQQREHARLRALGAYVTTVYGVNGVDAFMDHHSVGAPTYLVLQEEYR